MLQSKKKVLRTGLSLNSPSDLKNFCNLILGNIKMSRDVSQDGQKCGDIGNIDRVFDFRDEDATQEKCERACLDDLNCVAYSATFGEWCIGCNRSLGFEHYGAISYVKNNSTGSRFYQI